MTRRRSELEAAGVAYVEATVVRCSAPSSARAGDRAIVLGDGTIDGFVGGSCADATVRLQALRALETGEPVLLRILPGVDEGPADDPGAVVVNNPCLSGGALELFLEPHLPPPRVAIAGDSPIAEALVELCGRVGFAARRADAAEPGDYAAVIASLGHGDEDALRIALATECEYVGLVASRRRGAAVLEALRSGGVPDEALARVRTPAGVAIGARTHAEIALAIAAELVAVRRAPAVVPTLNGASRAAPEVGVGDATAAAAAGPAARLDDVAPAAAREAVDPVDAAPAAAREAVDPVCGMTVAMAADTPTAGGHAFCCEGCRDVWLARA